MAGIGFELKKLFRKNRITGTLVGILHSTFTTIGHMLIMIGILIGIQVYLAGSGTNLYERELFSSAILYAFVFPFIFTSGMNIILSRYIADSLYAGRLEKILPSMYGSLAVMLVPAGTAGGVFYYLASPSLDASYKLAAYVLYMEMCVLFHISVYVSAIKKYDRITLSYVAGLAFTALAAYPVLTGTVDVSGLMLKATYLLFAFAAGILIVIAGIVQSVRKHFSMVSPNYFEFLLYFRRYPQLFFLNTFYTLGLYVHNFIFWAFPASRDVLADTFVYSADYDMASFLGMLIVLPAMVFFVVRIETSVYIRYRAYLKATNGGTGFEIEAARKNLVKSVWQEVAYIIEVQVIASLILIVLLLNLLPRTGMSNDILELFPFLAYGFYFSFIMFLMGTLLLYFVRHTDVLKIYFLFFAGNAVFTVMTIYMGNDFYGLGLILAGMVSFAAAFSKLKETMNKLDYLIFCSEILRPEYRITWFDRAVARLDGKKI